MLQGRGEFVRLILEDQDIPYEDVVRTSVKQGNGLDILLSQMKGQNGSTVFAPPILKFDDVTLSQMPTICRFLGEKHNLAPNDYIQKTIANQHVLTICDVLVEAHDTHHPISKRLTYEEQKPESKSRATLFLQYRLPEWMGYFESLLSQGEGHIVAGQITYADLALWQVLEGLAYAFPKGYAQTIKDKPKLLSFRSKIADRPRLAQYLESDRRIPFNETGIFRYYPELDLD